MKLKIFLLVFLLIGLAAVWREPIKSALEEQNLSDLRAPVEGSGDDLYARAMARMEKNPEKNIRQSLPLLEAAAEKDHELAIRELVDIYNHQKYGVDRDLGKTFYYLKKGAQFEAPDLLYILGLAYSTGAGTPEDAAQAFHWFKKSADADYSHALYMTGLSYMNGEGVPRDYERARFYFEKSKDSKPESLHALATLYQFGYGVEKDDVKSLEYLKQAALQGVPEAEYTYARQLEKSAGNEEDWLKIGQMYVAARSHGITYADKALQLQALACTGGVVPPLDEWRGTQNAFLKPCLISLADGHLSALYLAGKYYVLGKGGAFQNQGLGYLKQAAYRAHIPSMLLLMELYNDGGAAYRDECLSYSWAKAVEKILNSGSRKIEIISRDRFDGRKDEIYASLDPAAQDACSSQGEEIFKNLKYERTMIY